MSEAMTQEDAMNMSNKQAEEILVPLQKMMVDQYGCPISEAYFAIGKAIEALNADVQEVKHGRWIDKYNDGNWHCSECGAIVEKDEQNRHNWYKCYHCGAKMEGER